MNCCLRPSQFSETGLSSQSTSFDRLVAEFGAGLLDSRDVPDEYLMFLPGILWQADGPSVDKLGEALAASSNPSHRAGGFLIQIQRGNLAALTRYRNDKGLKPSQIGVLDLTSALNWRDPNPEAIKVLGELSREPAGKTAPLALQTLRRLRSKETLPYFALALENSDADVQYQGMAGLAEFANGFWQKPGPEGAARTGVPGRVTEFTSSDTLSHFPAVDTFRESREGYVNFWQAWWQANKAGIGF